MLRKGFLVIVSEGPESTHCTFSFFPFFSYKSVLYYFIALSLRREDVVCLNAPHKVTTITKYEKNGTIV